MSLSRYGRRSLYSFSFSIFVVHLLTYLPIIAAASDVIKAKIIPFSRPSMNPNIINPIQKPRHISHPHGFLVLTFAFKHKSMYHPTIIQEPHETAIILTITSNSLVYIKFFILFHVSDHKQFCLFFSYFL